MTIKFAATPTWVKISDVKPYEKNAKVHPREQIDDLKQQFREHAFDVLIVVDKDFVIIKGHGRYESLTELDAEGEIQNSMIPVLVRDDLSAEQVRLARIADNRLGESQWNFDMLTIELLELKAENADLKLTGIGDLELKGLIEPKQSEPRTGSKELDKGDFQKFDHKCPKCSYEWNAGDEPAPEADDEEEGESA